MTYRPWSIWPSLIPATHSLVLRAGGFDTPARHTVTLVKRTFAGCVRMPRPDSRAATAGDDRAFSDGALRPSSRATDPRDGKGQCPRRVRISEPSGGGRAADPSAGSSCSGFCPWRLLEPASVRPRDLAFDPGRAVVAVFSPAIASGGFASTGAGQGHRQVSQPPPAATSSIHLTDRDVEFFLDIVRESRPGSLVLSSGISTGGDARARCAAR